jgi:ParB family transcriptional regulator, chromosome partitioning protein
MKTFNLIFKNKIKFKLVDIDTIITAKPFKALFPIKPITLDEIKKDMEKKGFDNSQPLVIWKEKQVLIDGHTRLESAKLSGIEKVPITEKSFQSEDKAIEYAIHLQQNRRNLTDAELINCITHYDSKKSKGRPKKGLHEPLSEKGKSADITAKKLGISPTKVKKLRAIEEKGNPELKCAVKSGEKTVNQAYAELKEKDNPQKPSNKLNRKLEILKYDFGNGDIEILKINTTNLPNPDLLESYKQSLVEVTESVFA